MSQTDRQYRRLNQARTLAESAADYDIRNAEDAALVRTIALSSIALSLVNTAEALTEESE